jgi:hypothetical protein
VDVKRAADFYAGQGRSLRQIGTELGVFIWSTVGQQLQTVGITTMRSGGRLSHAASTQRILELRDQGLTWTDVAEQVDALEELPRLQRSLDRRIRRDQGRREAPAEV